MQAYNYSMKASYLFVYNILAAELLQGILAWQDVQHWQQPLHNPIIYTATASLFVDMQSKQQR